MSPPPKRKCSSDIRVNLLGETFNGGFETSIVNGKNKDLIEFSKCDDTSLEIDLDTPNESNLDGTINNLTELPSEKTIETPEKKGDLNLTEKILLSADEKIITNDITKSPVPNLKEDLEIDDLDLMLEEAGLKSGDEDNLYLSEVDEEKEIIDTVNLDSSSDCEAKEEITNEESNSLVVKIVDKPKISVSVDKIESLEEPVKPVKQSKSNESDPEATQKDENQEDPDGLLVEIKYQPPELEQNEEDKRDSDQKSETSSHEPNLMDDNANQNDFEMEQSESEAGENIGEESDSNLNSNDIKNLNTAVDNSKQKVVQKTDDSAKSLKRAKTANDSDNENLESEEEVAPVKIQKLSTQLDPAQEENAKSSICLLTIAAPNPKEEEVDESKSLEEIASKLAVPIEKSMQLSFLKMFNKPIEEMSLPMLEDLLMQTVLQSLIYKSDLAKVYQKLEQQDKTISAMQRKANELSKHYADMDMIHSRVIKDLETRNEGMVTPVKITRAVGLQVYQPPRGNIKPAMPTKMPVPEKKDPSSPPTQTTPTQASPVVYRKTPDGVRIKTTRKITPMRPQPPIISAEIPPEQPKLSVKPLTSLLTKPLPHILPKPAPQQNQPKTMQHTINYQPAQKSQQYIINQQLSAQQLTGMANKTLYV